MLPNAADPDVGRPSGVRTPTAGHKRGRETQPSSSPLARLLEQIRRIKLPSVDADTANRLLGPFIREALKYDERGTLLAIVQQFGWQAGGEFSQAIDLGSFSLLLQKYRYERLQELGSGSYAVVYKARNRETDEVIALKKLRFGFDEQGLPSSTLREISLLKELKHANIVELKDIIYGFGTNNVYVVLECLDCDLRHLLDAEKQLEMRQIKSFLQQILKAVNHAHMHCVMHRDLKPQNILVDASHTKVKVADFGLARSFLPPFKAYTDKVVTLWYRAPELLLGVNSYSTAIDMWSMGCIFAEMLNCEPLFRAESEIGLLHKIFEALGTPNDSMWSGVERLTHYRHNFPQWQPKDWGLLVPRLAAESLGVDLLASMLAYDPEARISAAQALKHPFFDDVRDSSSGNNSRPAAQSVQSGSAATAGAGPAMAAARVATTAHAGMIMPAARPPAGPSMVGNSSRDVQIQQPLDQQHQMLQSLHQPQQHPSLQLQLQQQHQHLQQLQLQLQLQQAQQHAAAYQLPMLAPAPLSVAAAAPAAAAGVQATCRGKPPAAWVRECPVPHSAPKCASGAPPTPA